MLRAPLIAITVLLLLLRSGTEAQHAPDWLHPATADQLPVVATIEPTQPSNEDFVTRELFVEPADGAVYLDRADLPLLPAVGLTWTPRPSTRLDLQFPQSRFAWRLAKDVTASETWISLSAGIGGNTWAVTRADGKTDEVSLGDIRLLLGLEHIVDGGGGWFADIGYAFNRYYEFQSDQVKTRLSDGVLLQAGWRY